MLEFPVWRDLVAAYVKSTARTAGWVVVRVAQSNSSRSLYIYLHNVVSSGVSTWVAVRISDHGRKGRIKPSSKCFSVKRSNTGHVGDLIQFLNRWRGYHPASEDVPTGVVGKPSIG